MNPDIGNLGKLLGGRWHLSLALKDRKDLRVSSWVDGRKGMEQHSGPMISYELSKKDELQ